MTTTAQILKDLRTPVPPALTYEQFVARKVTFDQRFGHTIDPAEVHQLLKPHQRALVAWAVAGGRRAVFASYGLGKSLIQLEVLRLTLAHHGDPDGRALIICPLSVRLEFAADAAKIGLDLRFVRRTEDLDGPGLYVTNYESVRDGRLDVNAFTAVSLDEASVLRSSGRRPTRSSSPDSPACPTGTSRPPPPPPTGTRSSSTTPGSSGSWTPGRP